MAPAPLVAKRTARPKALVCAAQIRYVGHDGASHRSRESKSGRWPARKADFTRNDPGLRLRGHVWTASGLHYVAASNGRSPENSTAGVRAQKRMTPPVELR